MKMEMKQTNTYRNSKQRRRILEVLRSTDTHPTANWIYDQLKGEFPSLSLGTVYRNLSILQEQGMVVRMASGSTFDRFDAVVEPHPHFYCRDCGRVIDISQKDAKRIIQPGESTDGHLVENLKIEYHGICAACREH
jgi:Fur family transcriptional regulator, peroxide stress response regulator